MLVSWRCAEGDDLARLAPLLTLAVILAVLPSAAAHAVPVRSQPADGSRHPNSPAEAWIDFSEPIEDGATNLTVIDARQQRHDDGRLQFPTLYRVQVGLRLENGTLADGGYLLHWTTISSVDGHKTQGAIAFAVGNASVPSAPSPPEAPVTWVTILAKAAAFVGLALVVGFGVFEAWVRLPGTKAASSARRRLGLAGAALQVAGLLLFAERQWQESGLLPREYFWGTQFGTGLAWRILASAGMVATLYARRWPRAWMAPVARIGLASVLLWLYASFSHTAANLRPPLWGSLVDLVHLAAVTAWGGGLAFLLVTLHADEYKARAQPSELARLTHRFHRLAVTSVLALTVTGVLMLGAVFSPNPITWASHVRGPYGWLLAWKIFLGLLMLSAGALNRFYFVARFRRHEGLDQRHAFRATVRAEALVGAAVFLLAGAATNFSPAFTAGGPDAPPPLALEGRGDVLRIRVTIDPPPSPANDSHFRVFLSRLADGSPIADAFRVRLTFQFLEADLGSSSSLAAPTGNGTYEMRGTYFPSAGRWALEATVQAPEVYLETARFEFEVR